MTTISVSDANPVPLLGRQVAGDVLLHSLALVLVLQAEGLILRGLHKEAAALVPRSHTYYDFPLLTTLSASARSF